METAAYAYGRRAAWFNVAVDYLDLFHRVVTGRRAGNRPVAGAKSAVAEIAAKE